MMDLEFFPEWNKDYEGFLERLQGRCGYDSEFSGICWHVGSKDCDNCPFHHWYFRGESATNLTDLDPATEAALLKIEADYKAALDAAWKARIEALKALLGEEEE